MGDDTSGVEVILSTSIASSNCSVEAAERSSSSDSLGISYSSPKGIISFDGMLDIGTASMGLVKELVKVFTLLGAEDSAVADAFLFFTAARSAALVFFASIAEGRLMLVIGAGGAEEIGAVSSGTTDVVALACSVSSGTVGDAST